MAWLPSNLLGMAPLALAKTPGHFGPDLWFGKTGAWSPPWNCGVGTALNQCCDCNSDSVSPRLTVQNLLGESTMMQERSSGKGT